MSLSSSIRVLTVAALFVPATAQVAVFDDKVPDALLALERAVNGWQTAHISWSRTSKVAVPKEEHFYETRMAGANWTRTDQGTARGRRVGLGSAENAVYLPEAEHLFFSPTAIFVRSDLSTSAARTTDFENRVVNDVRVIGLAPRAWNGTPQQTLYGNPENAPDPSMPRKYRTEIIDGLHVVTSINSDGHGMRWHIDPRKGWNATRIQELQAGEVVNETKVTLEKWGDTWFPKRVEGPFATVRVHSASFDRPDHPKTLSVEDIGIDVGILIGEKGYPPRFWDGAGMISVDDYVAKINSGELVQGESCARAWANKRRRKQMYANAVPAPPLEYLSTATTTLPRSVGELDHAVDGLWKAYTEKFIARYALRDAQTVKARGILKDCQEQGRRYLNSHRSKLDILEARVRELRERRVRELLRAGKADTKRVDVAKRQFAEAAAPLDKIFEEQLKPRLNKLPTRKQRAAAEK